jgi:hypothetical protein
MVQIMTLEILINYIKVKMNKYHFSSRDLIETTEVLDVLTEIQDMIQKIKGE